MRYFLSLIICLSSILVTSNVFAGVTSPTVQFSCPTANQLFRDGYGGLVFGTPSAGQPKDLTKVNLYGHLYGWYPLTGNLPIDLNTIKFDMGYADNVDRRVVCVYKDGDGKGDYLALTTPNYQYDLYSFKYDNDIIYATKLAPGA